MKAFFITSTSIKSWFFIFRIGVTVLILTFLVLSIGIDTIINTFKTVKPSIGLIAGGCLITLFFLGAFNVWIILKIIHPISFFAFLPIYSYSWALSLISPGQAGDASLIVFLKKYGIPFHQTGLTYMLDKSITVIIFFFIAWIGSYFFLGILEGVWVPLLILFFLITTFLMIMVRYFPSGDGVTKKIRDWMDNLLSELYRFKSKWYVLLLNSQLTIAKWLVLSACYLSAFLSFNVNVNWPEIGVIPILTSLVGYIPISISGIGTVEYSAAYLFAKIGVHQSVVLSVYLFLRTLQYLLAAGLLVFLRSGGKDER